MLLEITESGSTGAPGMGSSVDRISRKCAGCEPAHRGASALQPQGPMARILASLLVSMLVVAGDAEAAPKKRPATTAAASSFDRQAAVTALSELSLQRCRPPNAERGEGHVTITFAPTGSVREARIDRGPWSGSPVEKCMVKAFKTVKVPAFKGEPVTVGKNFVLE